MADIWSIISSNYATVGASTNFSNTRYKPVDAPTYTGTWTGAYVNNQKFSIQITNVVGFRAKVRYQSGTVLTYQDVLIKDDSFRFGNSKFTLVPSHPGTAQVKTVMTDPATGAQTLQTSYATKQT